MSTVITDVMVAEVLEKDADLLVTEGWCRGSSRKRDKLGRMSYCTVGAIYQVLQLDEDVDVNRSQVYWKAIRLLDRAIPAPIQVVDPALLGDIGFNDDQNVIHFNDHVAKEVGDVTDVLLRVAKDLRNAQ